MNTKTNNTFWLPLGLLLLLVAASGWFYAQHPGVVPEQPVVVLELAEPISIQDAELSGLGWYGDMLILLPQYPERFGEGDGVLFAISKQDILAYLDGTHPTPLQPAPISLLAPGLKESILHYEGFESIGFHGDRVFLTIEAGKGDDMHGYLVAGSIAPDLSHIALDVDKVAEIPVAFRSSNHTDEALVITDDSVLTFFEINGADLNPAPAVHVFGFDLTPQGTIPFPAIEYRVTDAALDGDTVWVINYFFPGDTDLLPTADPIAEKYGEGHTHIRYDHVERLVALTYSPDGITLAETAPIQLTLNGEYARNIEGLVMLDDEGFLLVTDKYPTTLLMFVPKP